MQEEACRRWEFEVLMGGRAGPGKTDVIVMKPLRYIDYSKFRGVIFRRTFPELEEVVDRTKQWYPAFGGEYKEGKSRWFFPSGATIKLSHMQHENDKYKHQTKEYQYIGFDEGTHFTPTQYLYMFSRARCTDGNIPVQINTGTNPGGVAHQFFKDWTGPGFPRFLLIQIQHANPVERAFGYTRQGMAPFALNASTSSQS